MFKCFKSFLKTVPRLRPRHHINGSRMFPLKENIVEFGPSVLMDERWTSGLVILINEDWR
jgi:hypothetical protein